MIYTEMTRKAVNLAFKAHEGTVGKDGLPYVTHPLHVAEDTDITLEQIRAMGFSEPVMEALTLLTHDKETPYLEYVAKVRENELARKVKMLDMRHNMDMSRLAGLQEADRERLEKKYRDAWRLLTDENEGQRRFTSTT